MGWVGEDEASLYPRWERCGGRTIWGPTGRYRVIHPGRRNTGAGPDYLGAVVAFPDGALRRGDVEIHSRAHSWTSHRHGWDPRYREVILHLICGGPVREVRHTRVGVIPTVPLPLRAAPLTPPCELEPRTLVDFPLQEEFLRTLAHQRWWRRQAQLGGRDAPGELLALAQRLGPEHHRLGLPALWEEALPETAGLESFLATVAEALVPEAAGRSHPRLPGRVLFLSALAHKHHHDRRRLWGWSLGEARACRSRLDGAGFHVPTQSFVLEVVGNWLLPLSAARTAMDRFDEWYRLPRGWIYARVVRQVARLGLSRPVNYGQQQGLLEWLETLCRPGECDGCPVTGARHEG